MNSVNTVIIQTALRPMKLVSITGTEFSTIEVADFAELFNSIEKLLFTTDVTLLVNRGPGSYAGIRTAIAYAYGLIHGRLLDRTHVKSYTSFDYVKAVTGHNGPIYLKSWPRHATGKLEESKGYFLNNDNETLYVDWNEIKDTSNLLIIGEEQIETTHEFRTYSEILNDAVGFRELSRTIENLSDSIEPLYINPVHIT